MADLVTNINQAISDFGTIKQAIINKGVEVPNGTKTSEYGNLINSIITTRLNPYFIYNNGQQLNNNTVTLYHKNGNGGVDENNAKRI